MGLFRQQQFGAAGGGGRGLGGAPALDHGVLTGLTDDDHPQYALLAGRSGGQTLIGGTATSDGLGLRPNAQASASTGIITVDLTHGPTEQIVINSYASLGTADIQNIIQINKGLTGLSGKGRIAGFTLSGSYDVDVDPNTIPFLVFNFNPTVRLISTTADLNTYRVFSTSGTVTVDGVAAGNTGSVFTPYDWVTIFSSANGGTAAFESGSGLRIRPTFDAGWTQRDNAASVLRGMEFDVNPTNQFKRIAAIDILNINAVEAITLRSAVAAAEMRHAGPGVFGANAAVTNGSIALEVQSTTQAFMLPRMNVTQAGAITTPADGMLIYVTNTDATFPTVGAYQRVGGAWAAI